MTGGRFLYASAIRMVVIKALVSLSVSLSYVDGWEQHRKGGGLLQLALIISGGMQRARREGAHGVAACSWEAACLMHIPPMMIVAGRCRHAGHGISRGGPGACGGGLHHDRQVAWKARVHQAPH